jgi:hypothetical protein
VRRLSSSADGARKKGALQVLKCPRPRATFAAARGGGTALLVRNSAPSRLALRARHACCAPLNAAVDLRGKRSFEARSRRAGGTDSAVPRGVPDARCRYHAPLAARAPRPRGARTRRLA